MDVNVGAVPLALTCWMAWIVPPDEDGDQFTHAVGSGTTVALCGVPTSCQGAPWPPSAASWAFPLPACEPCDEALHGH